MIESKKTISHYMYIVNIKEYIPYIIFMDVYEKNNMVSTELKHHYKKITVIEFAKDDKDQKN